MRKQINLGLIQFAMDKSAEKNREKAVQLIKEAAQKGAQIVCLPELFTSPYFCTVEDAPFDYAEALDGETSKILSEAAKDNSVILVGGSFHEKDGKQYYNTSLVFDEQGKNLGHYRKTHIPHDPCFYEKNYFREGNTSYKIFETKYAKIAVLICYDQWFPEAARSLALLGADIIFYPTAIATIEGVQEQEGNWQEAWENVQRGHAIANSLIVAAVNRVGKEGASEFWGGSFICNAFGKTLARAGREQEVLVQEVDLEHSRYVREGWRFFYNRRPETYELLTKKI